MTTDAGMQILPTATFATCPQQVDILFVPGGFGTTAAIADPEAVGFLTDRGRTARYVTSVCTGSLLLGAAGLLDGYRAAVHWGFSAIESLLAEGKPELHRAIDGALALLSSSKA